MSRSLIYKYRKMSFENRTLFIGRLSILINLLLGIAKFVLAFFFGVFFFVSGFFNVLIGGAKMLCILGIKKGDNYEAFKKRNMLIFLIILIAATQYIIYMLGLIIWDHSTMKYPPLLGIAIAFISFLEMGCAIYGLIKVSYRHHHYYRNIKIINFCSALTAIVTTEIAIMSFASTTDASLMNAIFGIVVGVFVAVFAVYILIAPHFSLIDKTLRYEIESSSDNKIELVLKESILYGDYVFVGKIKDNICEGKIYKTKNRIMQIPIYFLIPLFVLSEILIFPYIIGYVVRIFKTPQLLKKADEEMLNLGYKKA